MLLAGEIDGDVELALQIVEGGAGDQHPTRVGNLLEPGGDIHAVPEHLVLLDEDIADIDADPEPELALVRHFGVESLDTPLDGDRRLGCSHRARELRQEAVSRRVDDPSMMIGDDGTHGLEMLVQSADRSRFVPLDEPAVAGDVGRQNRRQPALGTIPHRNESSTRRGRNFAPKTRSGPGGQCANALDGSGSLEGSSDMRGWGGFANLSTRPRPTCPRGMARAWPPGHHRRSR